LPTLTTTFQTAATAVLTGATNFWFEDELVNALDDNGVSVPLALEMLPGESGHSNYLVVTNTTDKLPADAVVSSITAIFHKAGAAGSDKHVRLVIAGSIVDASDNPSGMPWTAIEFSDAVTWLDVDDAFTWPTTAQINAGDFGIAFAADYAAEPLSSDYPSVEFISVEFEYTLAGSGAGGAGSVSQVGTMFDKPSIAGGGYKVLGVQAQGSLNSSQNPFSSAPAGTKMVLVTVTGADVRLTFDGTTVPTSTVGNIFASGQSYWLPLNETEAEKVKAIETSASAAMYASFWGLV
jgi:hypothetical protein